MASASFWLSLAAAVQVNSPPQATLGLKFQSLSKGLRQASALSPQTPSAPAEYPITSYAICIADSTAKKFPIHFE